MKFSKLIFSIAFCLTAVPSLVDAMWTDAQNISSLDVYPGDGSSNKKPVAVINLQNGEVFALQYGNDNSGGDLAVQTLMHAFTVNKRVKIWYEYNPVYYYYQTNGTTWSTAILQNCITAISVVP